MAISEYELWGYGAAPEPLAELTINDDQESGRESHGNEASNNDTQQQP